jgi:hypothetical protein
VKRPPLALALVAVPALVLLVLHLGGTRAHLGFLSGTRVDVGEALLGVTYALAWFGVVIIAPIVVLARLLAAGAAWIQSGRWRKRCSGAR